MPGSMRALINCSTPYRKRAGFRVKLVATQPDRPSGRGMTLAESPVKRTALALGLPVVQPEKIKNNDEFRALLESLAPEAIVVVGYGRIISQPFLLFLHGRLAQLTPLLRREVRMRVALHRH